MLLTEIDHVAIAVHDLEAAIDYYRDDVRLRGRAPGGRRARRRRGGAAQGRRLLHPAPHAEPPRLDGREVPRDEGRGHPPRRLPRRRLRGRARRGEGERPPRDRRGSRARAAAARPSRSCTRRPPSAPSSSWSRSRARPLTWFTLRRHGRRRSPHPRRPSRTRSPSGSSSSGSSRKRRCTPARRRRSGASTSGASSRPASASTCCSTPGTFVELDMLARHRAHGFGIEQNRPLTDGVVTGWGTVDGRKVFVFSPGLHDLRRRARRGVRREDPQGDGPRRVGGRAAGRASTTAPAPASRKVSCRSRRTAASSSATSSRRA